jgi:hypothetical protein
MSVQADDLVVRKDDAGRRVVRVTRVRSRTVAASDGAQQVSEVCDGVVIVSGRPYPGMNDQPTENVRPATADEIAAAEAADELP